MTNLYSPEAYRIEPLDHCKRQVSLSEILEAVAGAYEYHTRHIVSRRQEARVTEARKVFCWLARELTPCTLGEIGRGLGNRDQTTIRYNIDRAEALRKESHYFLRKCSEARAGLYE